MMLRNQLDKAIDRTEALKIRTKQLQDPLAKGNMDKFLDLRDSLLKGPLPMVSSTTARSKALEQGA
jgi:hypothetical protein